MKLDAWEQALSDAMGERADDVPKGWVTVTAFQSMRQPPCSPATANRDMRALVNSGRAERKMFRVERGGVIRPVPHYRLKK